MEDPSTGRTVAYVVPAPEEGGEGVVAMRSPRNRSHLYFHYFHRRVFPDVVEDSGGDAKEEVEEEDRTPDGGPKIFSRH